MFDTPPVASNLPLSVTLVSNTGASCAKAGAVCPIAAAKAAPAIHKLRIVESPRCGGALMHRDMGITDELSQRMQRRAIF